MNDVVLFSAGLALGLFAAETTAGRLVRKAILLPLRPFRATESVFDLGHLLLNLPPLHTLPTWVNLGYWRTATTYSEACEDLARVLAKAARVRPGDDMVDVGVGCGDQDVLLAREFRPRSVIALNISTEQTAVAQRNVAEAGVGDVVDVRVGDGARLDGVDAASVDKVLSLDSAYHYETREAFFASSMRVLRPGGTLAVADMIPAAMPSSWLGRTLAALLARVNLVPPANLYDAEGYRARLLRAGFVDVRMEHIEEYVFAGFAAFMREHHASYAPLIARDAWTRYTSAGRALAWAANSGRFHYVIVTAEKPQVEQ